MEPRVLVISHTSFTMADSMGSTLASYFSTYNPHNVAQFYIKDMLPDIPVCYQYFCVTDRELLNKLFNPFSQKVGSVIQLTDVKNGMQGQAATVSSMGGHKHRDAALLLRKALWGLKLWNNKRFKNWMESFDPQVILVQPGDFSYLLDIGVYLAKKYHIPIVVHQSETYYLKEFEKKSIIYRLYRRDYKNSYDMLMKHTSYCVYLCEAIERGYKTVFDIPSTTIMKSTIMKPAIHSHVFDKQNPRFIYGGNLGETVGRCEPLIELGKVIKKLGSYIDVYTSSTGEHMKMLTPDNGVILHGSLPYDELQKKIKDSDFVIHLESQKPWNVKDLEYAFSTKIADMLASGVCSVVYGSEKVASVKYFKDHKLGCVIEKKEDIEPLLRELIDNEAMRKKYVEKAIAQAKNEHNPTINSDRMKDIICEAYEHGFCSNW